MCSSQNIESMPWKEDTQWTSKKASQTRMEPMKHNLVLIIINILINIFIKFKDSDLGQVDLNLDLKNSHNKPLNKLEHKWSGMESFHFFYSCFKTFTSWWRTQCYPLIPYYFIYSTQGPKKKETKKEEYSKVWHLH